MNPTRKEFLKTAGAAEAAMLVTSSLSGCAAAMKNRVNTSTMMLWARRVFVLFYLFLPGALLLGATTQSVADLQAAYSGTTDWNSGTGTLTFTGTGAIYFNNKTNYKNNYWDVPQNVSKIIIHENVTVTGAFHTYYNCTIEGVNRHKSIVYGTHEQRWADNRNLDEWNYCQFQNWGGVLTVKNLTALNPYSYFIRGWGKVNHITSCDFIDNRGGWHNHSDGFEGGHGSTVDDCYFETGDDAIKLYFDVTVTNTRIKMIQNCVPFQFGWGTYQDSRSVINNVTIIGEWGRGSDCPVFQWKNGSDKKTVIIHGLNVQNVNASIFELQSSGTLNLDIINSCIKVKNYGTASFQGTRTICGTTEQRNIYDCLQPDTSPVVNADVVQQDSRDNSNPTIK
jgi:hypothetical protein